MCGQATNIVRSFAAVGSHAPDKAIPAAILDGAAGFAILSVAKVCARFAPCVATCQALKLRGCRIGESARMACLSWNLLHMQTTGGLCLICWSPATSRILIGGHPGLGMHYCARSQDGCKRGFDRVSWRHGCCYCSKYLKGRKGKREREGESLCHASQQALTRCLVCPNHCSPLLKRRARGNKPLHSMPSHTNYTNSQWNGKWDKLSRSERERVSRLIRTGQLWLDTPPSRVPEP
jgi:hypothetical protein